MRSLFPILALLLLPACGSKGVGEKPRQDPLVAAATVTTVPFVDRIDAVGTARAREQVTLSAPVTERILRVNFQDGGFVRAGQVVAVLAQGQEEAQLAEARAQEREARQQLARLKTLKERGFATKASLDAQLAAADTARAQAASAVASIGDRVVRAPFSGWASLRMISAGTVVQAGTPIATISDLSEIKLDFPVPETLLASVAPGQPVVARAAAFRDERFRGRIATIDPVVDPATRSAMVRAILPNPQNRLKPGMLLRVTIESAPRTAAAVPELAVVGEGEARYVFLIGDRSMVRRVPVRTGVRDRGLIEIVAGLRPGQKVVGEGVVKVSDGMSVRLANAQPTRPLAGRE